MQPEDYLDEVAEIKSAIATITDRMIPTALHHTTALRIVTRAAETYAELMEIKATVDLIPASLIVPYLNAIRGAGKP